MNEGIKKQEQKLELNEFLSDIRSNLSKQPKSIQDHFEKLLEVNFFPQTRVVNGYRYIFSKNINGIVLSLVEDKNKKGIWKTRVFRYSDSDNQWKSIPGIRFDGSAMKGDESSPLHHYVQSGKLSENISKVLADLPTSKSTIIIKETKTYTDDFIISLLPKKNEDGTFGTYGEEFEFKEEYGNFKNVEWNNFQSKAQKDLLEFMYSGLNPVFRTAWFLLSKKSKFYKILESSPCPEFDIMKQAIDKLHEKYDFIEEIAKNHNATKDKNQDEMMLFYKDQRKILEAYRIAASNYIIKIFSQEIPKTLFPDFSKQPVNTYSKGSENLKIDISEYLVESSDGDAIIFSMAKDSKGRVWIDNIYYKDSRPNDYGIYEPICQMGYLVYKTTDYDSQVENVPEEYRKRVEDSRRYVDISKLLELIPIVAEYK